MIVYAHINRVNGKIYIGVTVQDPRRRWENGKGYRPCTAFKNAIKKYGWKNFDHYVLFDLPEEQALKWEAELIEMTSDWNYNIRSGGEHSRIAETTKRKISKAIGKPVKCLENGKTYPSAAAAAKELGIRGHHITETLTGKRRTCQGFSFKKA